MHRLNLELSWSLHTQTPTLQMIFSGPCCMHGSSPLIKSLSSLGDFVSWDFLFYYILHSRVLLPFNSLSGKENELIKDLSTITPLTIWKQQTMSRVLGSKNKLCPVQLLYYELQCIYPFCRGHVFLFAQTMLASQTHSHQKHSSWHDMIVIEGFPKANTFSYRYPTNENYRHLF